MDGSLHLVKVTGSCVGAFCWSVELPGRSREVDSLYHSEKPNDALALWVALVCAVNATTQVCYELNFSLEWMLGSALESSSQ